MHRKFKAISISHKNASVSTREQLALNQTETADVLDHIRDMYAIRDVLVLSTCNRTEVYYASDVDLGEDLVKLLALKRNIAYSNQLLDCFELITSHDLAVTHLFHVTIGLESQIVGDMQITNQVKQAYQQAADADLAGPFLHRLLHTTFYVNKKVVQETGFRDGAASVSYATLELIEQLAVYSENPTILLAGLGTIGSDLCKNLAGHKSFESYHVVLANRTKSTSETLAKECGFQAIDWSELPQQLNVADVIVSAVSSSEPIIRKSEIQNQDTLRYKYFIDLAMPRSIEGDVEDINGAVLYNIDDIQSRTDKALARRMESIPQVQSIVKDSIEDFHNWSKEMSVNPTINKLKNALEQIRRDEIARYLKNASEEEANMVEKVTKSMMQKVIKLPVLQLKAACKRGEAETVIDLLNDLFNLEQESSSQE